MSEKGKEASPLLISSSTHGRRQERDPPGGAQQPPRLPAGEDPFEASALGVAPSFPLQQSRPFDRRRHCGLERDGSRGAPRQELREFFRKRIRGSFSLSLSLSQLLMLLSTQALAWRAMVLVSTPMAPQILRASFHLGSCCFFLEKKVEFFFLFLFLLFLSSLFSLPSFPSKSHLSKLAVVLKTSRIERQKLVSWKGTASSLLASDFHPWCAGGPKVS